MGLKQRILQLLEMCYTKTFGMSVSKINAIFVS